MVTKGNSLHLVRHGYILDDCVVCRTGERPGIHWVDTERSQVRENGRIVPVLLCSSCLGDALTALAEAVPDDSPEE